MRICVKSGFDCKKILQCLVGFLGCLFKFVGRSKFVILSKGLFDLFVSSKILAALSQHIHPHGRRDRTDACSDVLPGDLKWLNVL